MTGLSRRDFLTRAAAGAGTIWLSAGAPALAAPVGAKMRFGLVTYLWAQHWDLPTLIERCEKSGVLGVELRTMHKHGVEPDLTAEAREAVKKRFADSPVEMIGIGSNECFDHPDPDALTKAIEATKAFVKLSHDVGGSGVKVKPNNLHKEVPREVTIEQIGKSLNTLAAFAADYGQQIRLEVHGECCLLPTMKQIMDVADHPNVGVCWNSNDQDLLGEGLEANFNLVKGRLGATAHVRELNIGNYPYQDLMGLFVRMDYAGWILLEAREEPAEPVQALIEQRTVFEGMVKKAQDALT
ncbi:MAG TPA: TIM barrel protein [Candidatus Hydrogenedentes bacterium]|nr:TIM barrel protein [Candidatus Hydrogenedentota bacterium]HPG68800.1 TIM barrel protein [Candidatus Hydrogenedentota bacterium]